MRYRVPGLQEELDSVDHFLKEMGMQDVDGQQTLKVSESGVLEETKIVLLEPVESSRQAGG
jgi:hypothetical protein